MSDDGVRGRQDYLMTKGWNWGFTGVTPIRTSIKRKLFPHDSDMLMRPTITVIGGNE